MNDKKKKDGDRKKDYYTGLYRKFILNTLLCSVIPLLLVGWAINIHYTRFAKTRMTDSFQTQIGYHQKIIELFLKRTTAKLHLMAQTHSRTYLGKIDNLARVFELINQEYGTLADLGVIDQEGRHVAYVGPYDLMDKNYKETHWFKKVMEKGEYVSDMFMGFRKVPHFIIAIARTEGDEKWILRATIDTEVFRSLVENIRIGKTGEVYLLNEEGFFQTSPRLGGRIMEKAPLGLERYHEGIKIRVVDQENARRQVVATSWLEQPRWMLVVKQEYGEAFDEVNYANKATLLFLHLSAVAILIVSILLTNRMVQVIRRRDDEAEMLNRQLMEAGKLASVGELSAGVAHEINNPLAIVLTERQILLDLAEQTAGLDEGFKEQLLDSLTQIDTQVNRCKRITHNLLRFSRRTKSVIEEVDLNEFLGEVVELVEREAKASGIRFKSELDESLNPILSDPSQLQQVFLNLITNAIDAHDGKPYGTIRIVTRGDDGNGFVRVVVADTGSGIRKEHLERVFDPFFTTKPVGRGTGLGLSICYGIVQRLGGAITVESEEGEGSEFTVTLPYQPPPDVQAGAEE